MKMFELPMIEIQMFAVEDVITISSNGVEEDNNNTSPDEI